MIKQKRGISQPRKSLLSPRQAPPHSFRRSLFQKGCSVQSILVFSIQHSFIMTGANNITVYIYLSRLIIFANVSQHFWRKVYSVDKNLIK